MGTGLLLVTGPFKLNGTPLRRVNQRFLLATSTKIDVSSVKVPENINDKYFARIKAEKTAKKEGDIFDAKKEGYKPSEQRIKIKLLLTHRSWLLSRKKKRDKL